MSYKKKAISAMLVLILGIFFTNTGAKADCNDLILGTPAINWGSANSAKANKVLDIVGKKIVFYYQNKNTGTVKEIIDMFNTIPDKELLLSLKNPGALKGLSGFFMGIFIENPDLYKEYRQQKNTGDVNYILDDAFMLSSVIKPLLERSQTTCLNDTSLDMYWGYFYATGDARAVATIKNTSDRAQPCKQNNQNCKKIYCKKDCTKSDLKVFASDLSAEWSLKSNAKYHPIVKEVLEK